MKLAIQQPCFLPWIPYFDLINKVDTFIFLDSVVCPQKQSFINRNRFFFRKKFQWIKLNLKKDERKLFLNEKKIKNLSINNKNNYLHIFEEYFKDGKKFKKVFELFKNITENYNKKTLSEYNITSIRQICEILNLKTKLIKSSDILDNEVVREKKFKGPDLVKYFCEKYGCQELYNFSSGIEKNIEPFCDISFFKKNNISLYRQEIESYFNDNDEVLLSSIIQVLLNFSEDEILSKMNINYKKIY